MQRSVLLAVVSGALATSVLAESAPAAADPPRLEVQAVAGTGSMPKGVSLSPDGSKVYVTNFGELNHRNVSVYDAKTLAQTDSIDVPGNVVESVLSPDGATLYVSNFRRGSVQFVDLASKTVTKEVKTGENPKVLAISPDGKTLFAANWSSNTVAQIDTEKGEVLRTLSAGRQPRGMVVSSSGTLYVANFWGESIDVFTGPDLATRTRTKTCKVPRHLALSPDEQTLYVSCLTASQLVAYDAATMKVTHRAQIGRAPKSISVSADGRYVYSADYGDSRSLSVVDTTDFTSRVFPVPGMDRGSGVVVYPDGKHALVTGWYDSHVYMVGFQGTGGDPAEAARKTRGWLHRAYTVEHAE
jgi:YVTN family beta-propeller protein